MDALAERLRALRIEAEDLGVELRGYLDGLDADPERLHEIEERLDGYDRLKRKHGGSVAAVLEHAERCRARARPAGGRRGGHRAGGRRGGRGRGRAGGAGGASSTAARREGRAEAGASAVVGELAALSMEGAAFEIVLEPREDVGPAGAERVDFLLARQPGRARHAAARDRVRRRALARDAGADDRGRGRVGAARWCSTRSTPASAGRPRAPSASACARSAGERQVLCITHLPQIAALAERHFRIEKSPEGEVATASVEQLPGPAVVEELCRMLGADADDKGARRHAKELLAAA